MTGAKICGLTTTEAVAAAVEGGAGYIGLMFFDRSPRNLTLDAAASLAEPARGRAKLVAVTVEPTDADLYAIVSALRPDLIQLHGSETPDRVAEIKARSGVGVIKVLPIGGRDDLPAVGAYESVADHLMFDAKAPPDATRPGGLGASFDWSLLSDISLARPWFLAGGLHPDNVALAVRASGAPLVDVSSGVEAAPGLKDPALIAAFLAQVRDL